MRYEGPIYRPPSEADALLIQATVGCPHNKCTFCMIYKNGPRFRIRPVQEIMADIDSASRMYGPNVKTLFFPAGNTIVMKTDDLAAICIYARNVFPDLERITVYGSSQYIHKKGLSSLKQLADAGLNRIHVGLESGNDDILRHVKKGVDAKRQIEAGQWVVAAGIELSLYVVLGLGGVALTDSHADATANALNRINPDFIRLRTFVPKINTPILDDVKSGKFKMLGPHGVLKETERLVRQLNVTSCLASDHYTNYIDVHGKLPESQNQILAQIKAACQLPESQFRPFFIGDQ
ncbi:radical SAM protein [Desulfobacter latus]|uniref:Radical SAM protein n=2 Tax=Desulfobacter latus TaxID=2292 RepID=A0A850SX63_9BACT|nr:radical SAM protein [Desulfobacter latus]NWH05914.1 radical SAM protein [Desulfobacter latus]